MARIGVGVIGCGDIARVRFFPSIEALPDLELKAVHSRTLATCEPIVARYGGVIHADLGAFLRDPDIGAVVIATPHPSHAELSIRALEAGRHVLTEKPMATSLADATRIRAAAERSGRVFMALPFDNSSPIESARRLIGSGAIGRVSSADAVLAHNGPTHAPWFFDRGKAEWGVLADLGIYLISQLTYLFGPAQSVLGYVTTVFPERTLDDGKAFTVTVEDNIAAAIAWPGNIVGTIRANWCSPSDKRNVICETRITGTKGIIFINLATPENAIVVHSPEQAIEGAEKVTHNGMTNCYRPTLSPWHQDRDIMRSFADAIANGGFPADHGSTAARQHHVIDIIAKLYESSKTGRAMSLETRP